MGVVGGRAVQAAGRIVAEPVLGGLHHQYVRIWAWRFNESLSCRVPRRRAIRRPRAYRAMNAERQLTSFSQGNGIQTTQTFNPQTGRLEAIQAGPSSGGGGNAVQNLTYQWDTLGNLLSRTDATQAPVFTEEFSYDALNRLTEAAIVDGPIKTYAYDSIGNITSKSDTGTYSYPTPGPSAVRPHAVTSVTGALNATYAYDANGNLTSGAGRTVTWMSFNMVATVNRGTNTLGFTYDSEHQRIKQYVSGTGETTIYINAEVRVEKVLDSGGNLIRWNNYIYAAGGMVAVEYDHATAADQTRYFHKDHLGSISVITDEAGTVVERLSYDAWGMRRFLNGADDLSETLGSSTDRGFTGHEHLQEVGLVHMNGRIYDPRLGRFMSADPFVQDPFNTQSLNRYSYVINNPLAYTDPNGYFFKSIFNAIKNIISNPKALVTIAVVAIVTWGVGAMMAQGALAAATAPGATAGVVGGGYAVGTTAFATAVIDVGGYITSLSALGSTVAGAAGGFAGGVLAGRNLELGFRGAVAGGVGGYVNAQLSGWQTTTSMSSAKAVTADNLRSTVTHWDQVVAKTAVAGVAGAAMAHIEGGDARQGFVMKAAFSFSSDMYRKYVPEGATWFGSSDEGYVKEPGTAYVRGVNNFGTTRTLDAPSWFQEGGFASRALSGYVPTMGSISLVHDAWSELGRGQAYCGYIAACPTTMLPAAAVTTGALLNEIHAPAHLWKRR